VAQEAQDSELSRCLWVPIPSSPAPTWVCPDKVLSLCFDVLRPTVLCRGVDQVTSLCSNNTQGEGKTLLVLGVLEQAGHA
jgi:hypothetical protein